MPLTLKDIFDIYETIVPNERGCRIWPKAKSNEDYPREYFDKKLQRLNRVFLTRKLCREIKPGYHALHECDTPACVSEEHLWEGTNLDNVRDCHRKGRNWQKSFS